jgi:hypothetical protein
MNKKASMELGINTVVVLVIAMVIIAGGIAFIRGFFSLGEKKLGGAFDIAEFGVQPSSVERIVLVEGTPTIKRTNTESVKVGYYNKEDDALGVFIAITDCRTTVANPNCATPDNPRPIISSLPQDVKSGESAGFETFITASCLNSENKHVGLTAGDYICNLKAAQGDENNPVILAETQIKIKITS